MVKRCIQKGRIAAGAGLGMAGTARRSGRVRNMRGGFCFYPHESRTRIMASLATRSGHERVPRCSHDPGG